MIGLKAKSIFVFFIIYVNCLGLSNESGLPSFIRPCYRYDPNLRKCLTEEGKRVLKRFADGIPELNLPPLDPMKLGDLDIMPNSALKITNKNAISRGLRSAILADLFIDVEKKTGTYRILGNSSFKSDYTIDGKLLVFPITGKGVSRIKMINYDMVMNWNWKLRKGEDGKEYAHITNATHVREIEKVVIKMDGLFNNDKALGDTMNRVLNENWRELMKELGPTTSKVVQQKIVELLNTFFEKVPFDELLPVEPIK